MINSLGTFKEFTDGTIKTVFDVGNKRIIEMSLFSLCGIKVWV